MNDPGKLILAVVLTPVLIVFAWHAVPSIVTILWEVATR